MIEFVFHQKKTRRFTQFYLKQSYKKLIIRQIENMVLKSERH